jgi:hypothetical protein
MPKFLASVDLNKNELLNARIQNTGTAPSSPVKGQIYFESTSANKLYVYNGTGWEKVLSGTISNGDVASDAAIAYSKLSLTGSIVNADVSASAAIAYSKLNLTGGIVNADLSNSAAIAYSKLNLTGSIVNADISTTAAIAYSKLNLSTSIVDGDIAANAAIAYSKLNLSNSVANTDLAGSITVTKLLTSGTNAVTLSSIGKPTTAVDVDNQKITNLAEPTSSTDAATKGYVDAAVIGIDWKPSVRVATTANITLSGTQTVDGVSLSVGDRVLVKNQTDAEDNGVYVVASSTWSRSTDANSDAEVTAGFAVWVNEGTTNADSGWVLTTNDPITVGTTELTFTQFSGAGQITAGDGLTKTGNTINAVGTTNRISVSADAIDISASYVGQNSITTLGTITTGTWNGTDIAVADGGTGASTAADARTNLAAGSGTLATKVAGAITCNTTSPITFTHNLGTTDVTVQVYDTSTGTAVNQVFPDIAVSSSNAVSVTFGANDGATYRVVVTG